MHATADFGALVDGFVRNVIADRVPASFDELVARLPGVYPTDAVLAVNRLREHGELDAVLLARLRRRDTRGGVAQTPSNPLPVPHPLDFDWRFSVSAVDRLVSECEARSLRRVVLLGVPSVFCALQGVKAVPALLLDANPAVIDAVSGIGESAHRARLCDLRRDALPKEQSGVVIVDPPWYREHERSFLWAAAQLCRQGGSVLVSMPGEGTRPGISAEREDALAWAGQLGLELETIDPRALAYLSPPFERNALSAVGFDGIPLEWRRGDLFTFRMRERSHVARPRCAIEPRWPEVTAGSVRLRIRSDRAKASSALVDPILRELVPGDVLETVSRRDPRRDSVAMWTSGNRVFDTPSPDSLLEVCRCLAGGADPEVSVAVAVGRRLSPRERRNVRSAMEQVSAVIDTERAELAAMGWAA